jgi:hypothetical protein
MSNVSLRRYTNLPFLLDLLHKKQLALLDPATWDDRNDAYYMEQYKKKKNLKTLLAVCFAEAPETYQHWKIYSGNQSGVCIEFDKDSLLIKALRIKGYRCQKIEYLPFRGKLTSVEKLPFTKRVAFTSEDEFRIIYEDEDEEIKIKYLPIIPEDIIRIEINPWVNESIYNSIVSTIKNIDGFVDVRTKKSGILEYEKWKKKADDVIVIKAKK